MKNISKITMAVSKTVEILHWAGAVFSAALLVCSFAAKDWLFDVVSKLIPEYGNEVSTYGFEMTAVDENGLLDMTVIRLFAIGSVIILSLMAMVFRNVYLVAKKSENDPFNKDNIRMIREIGIFFIRSCNRIYYERYFQNCYRCRESGNRCQDRRLNFRDIDFIYYSDFCIRR